MKTYTKTQNGTIKFHIDDNLNHKFRNLFDDILNHKFHIDDNLNHNFHD